MTRRDKTVLLVAAALLAIAVFALVAGGFLWPRPQFRNGPWEAPPMETAPETPAALIALPLNDPLS